MRTFIFLLLLVFSIPVFAQIKISKAKGVNISASKTFAIEKGQVVAFNNEKIDEAKIFSSFTTAVNEAMASRGYTLVTDSTAHLVISYVYEESDRSQFQKEGPLGQKPIDDPADVDETYKLKRSHVTRTLIIDIVNNKNSVWTATCGVESQKDLGRSFELTVESAFKKFPAQGSKK